MNNPAPQGTTASDRLESWKEIAAYLRRGVRTAVRWEKEEGLPVHRHVHHKLGSIYALKSELDAWRAARANVGGATTPAPPITRRKPDRVVIAVLPFENLSGAPTQMYLADGLTEEMISELGRFSPATLGVIARTTVMQYRESNKPRSIKRIAEELNVDYVLEGSVRSEKDHVRVTVQLIDGRDQTHLWAGATTSRCAAS